MVPVAGVVLSAHACDAGFPLCPESPPCVFRQQKEAISAIAGARAAFFGLLTENVSCVGRRSVLQAVGKGGLSCFKDDH